MRAILGRDAVDTKRNRLTAARVEKLVHFHQNCNALGQFETKGLSDMQLAAGLSFFTRIASVTVTRELCL